MVSKALPHPETPRRSGQSKASRSQSCWDTPCRQLQSFAARSTEVRHAARFVVLHRAWRREFCRSLRYWAGEDDTRGHERRACQQFSGTTREYQGVGESRFRAHNPKVAGSNPAPAPTKMQVRADPRGSALVVQAHFSNGSSTERTEIASRVAMRSANTVAASACMPGSTCW